MRRCVALVAVLSVAGPVSAQVKVGVKVEPNAIEFVADKMRETLDDFIIWEVAPR